MLEQVTPPPQYVFHPLDEERGELFTNKDVKRFAIDKFRAELMRGAIGRSNASFTKFTAFPNNRAVKPPEMEIEVFKPGKEGQIYAENKTVKTNFLPKFKLSVKQLFAG